MFKAINVTILISFCFLLGCSQVNARLSAKEQKAAQDYERANNEADKAFDELDSEIEKLNQKDNSSAPSNTGKGVSVKDAEHIAKPAVKLEDKGVVEKQSPRADINKKRPISCDNNGKLLNGLPDWVISPHAEGYSLTAVGLGIYGDGGFAGQKRAARIQAQGEIARMLNVKIENELDIEKTYKKNAGEDKIITEMSSYSRQRASELLEFVEELKCWIDPTNNDYYVLLGVSSDKVQ